MKTFSTRTALTSLLDEFVFSSPNFHIEGVQYVNSCAAGDFLLQGCLLLPLFAALLDVYRFCLNQSYKHIIACIICFCE